MAKYIELDALVADIEKIIADETESIKSFEHNKNASEVQRSNARIGVLTHLRSLLDTLEVKEVDLEEESISWEDISQLISIAVKLKTDVYLNNKKMTEEMFYTEVLKRFKAQKGE